MKVLVATFLLFTPIVLIYCYFGFTLEAGRGFFGELFNTAIRLMEIIVTIEKRVVFLRLRKVNFVLVYKEVVRVVILIDLSLPHLLLPLLNYTLLV